MKILRNISSWELGPHFIIQLLGSLKERTEEKKEGGIYQTSNTRKYLSHNNYAERAHWAMSSTKPSGSD